MTCKAIKRTHPEAHRGTHTTRMPVRATIAESLAIAGVLIVISACGIIAVIYSCWRRRVRQTEGWQVPAAAREKVYLHKYVKTAPDYFFPKNYNTKKKEPDLVNYLTGTGILGGINNNNTEYAYFDDDDECLEYCHRPRHQKRNRCTLAAGTTTTQTNCNYSGRAQCNRNKKCTWDDDASKCTDTEITQRNLIRSLNAERDALQWLTPQDLVNTV